MAYRLLKIVSESDAGTSRATPVDALYLDGYDFGDRLLEGIPFKITVSGQGLAAKMILEEEIRRGLRIDRAEAEHDAVRCALETDLFSLNSDLGDDNGILFNDAVSLDEQSFGASPDFRIEDPD